MAGGCTHTEVIICNCDGTDPPGTCQLGCGGGGGGGPSDGGGGIYWGTTCYNFYDSYTVCVEYQGEQSCETSYDLIESFCI